MLGNLFIQASLLRARLGYNLLAYLNNQLSTYLLAVFGKWEEPLPYYNDQAYPLKNMHVPQA